MAKSLKWELKQQLDSDWTCTTIQKLAVPYICTSKVTCININTGRGIDFEWTCTIIHRVSVKRQTSIYIHKQQQTIFSARPADTRAGFPFNYLHRPAVFSCGRFFSGPCSFRAVGGGDMSALLAPLWRELRIDNLGALSH